MGAKTRSTHIPKWKASKATRIGLLALTSLLLAACTDAADEPDGGETAEITFRQFDPPAESEGLSQLIDEWNDQNPDIQVTMESTTDEEVLDGYVREVQAGEGPDIIHLGLASVPQTAEPGLLADLSDYLEEDPPGEGYDDFLATELVELEGKVYGLPWTIDTFTIAYHPDVLAEAGLEGPPEDWEALYQYAVTIREETGEPGFCFPAGSGSNSWGWFLFNYHLWSNGSTLVQDAGDAHEIGTDEDAVAETFTYMKSFFEEDATPQAMLEVNESGEPAITEALAAGECGMAFMAPANFEAAREASDAELGTFVVPEGDEQRISHLGGRVLGLNPNSDHPDEAWEFLSRLMEADVFEEYYDQFPAQQTLLDEVDFDEAVKGYVEMLPRAITFEEYATSPIGLPPLWDQVATSLGSVLSDQTTPEESAASLLDFIRSELE